jgi:hypothetical protein
MQMSYAQPAILKEGVEKENPAVAPLGAANLAESYIYQ